MLFNNTKNSNKTRKPDSQKLTNFFILGDSLSDSNGLATAGAVLLNAGKIETVETIMMPSPFVNNSFTNGDVSVKVLAEKMGWPLTAGWSFIYKDEKYSKYGNNYAIAGATTGPMDNLLSRLFFNHFNLANQAAALLEQHNVKATDLIIVQIGGNDLINILTENTARPVKQEQLNKTLINLEQTLNTLIEQGVQNLLLINSVDLGSIPYFQNNEQRKLATEFTKNYNAGIVKIMTKISDQKNKIIIKQYDLFTRSNEFLLAFQELDHHHNITDPCVNFDFKELRTGKIVPKYYDNTSPKHLSKHFFFDNFHPTTWAHQKVAEDLYQIIEAW
ncbi:SGNH/GDSL hydrolase family protein [Spiroplasma chrysopicola]|uniref:Putative GDSL family lipolytic enzyme n=1 Tax=Spiroplasma chrysopicola DF-1 TaxID=1276227 RepID=R4UC14_9MOLU|nr:SGNH/GDSL hydrolase family protein [Spiroplasma chrysopicola]AGM25454.1 putative GDSL family lipolytic enzyme [Spiroplasma chrysopicola DF-1]